jgi:hypothetical protein
MLNSEDSKKPALYIFHKMNKALENKILEDKSTHLHNLISNIANTEISEWQYQIEEQYRNDIKKPLRVIDQGIFFKRRTKTTNNQNILEKIRDLKSNFAFQKIDMMPQKPILKSKEY